MLYLYINNILRLNFRLLSSNYLVNSVRTVPIRTHLPLNVSCAELRQKIAFAEEKKKTVKKEKHFPFSFLVLTAERSWPDPFSVPTLPSAVFFHRRKYCKPRWTFGGLLVWFCRWLREAQIILPVWNKMDRFVAPSFPQTNIFPLFSFLPWIQ